MVNPLLNFILRLNISSETLRAIFNLFEFGKRTLGATVT